MLSNSFLTTPLQPKKLSYSMPNSKQYIQLFKDHRALLDKGSCATMNAAREAAALTLAQKGLPTKRTEEYRYTDVQAAFTPDYGVNLQRLAPNVDAYATYKCNVPNLSTTLLFVVNDSPIPLPENTHLPEGVRIHRLSESNDFLAEYYNRAATDGDAIAALNTMLAQDGILIYLPANTTLKHPIQIVNVCDAAYPMLSNRRLLVIADEGAEAQILLCDHTATSAACLTTMVAEVFAGNNAKLDFCCIEENGGSHDKFAHYYVQQQAGSRVTMNGVTLHTGHTCNRIRVRLLGSEAESITSGAVIAGGKELVDNHLVVEHIAPNCHSDMLFKYVLDGESVGAFAGKVLVHEGAQKTASQQTNANLCASSEARAFSQPMLEIYADDVKCNHGSTIGKLDENALFYMRQRGIPESEARLLLQHAFVNEVLQRIEPEHLRDRLAHLVELRFRGALQKCEGCKMCK